MPRTQRIVILSATVLVCLVSIVCISAAIDKDLEELVGVLKSSQDPSLRRNAALRLAEAGQAAQDAAPVLVECLSDPSIRQAAQTALASIGKGAVASLIAALGDEDRNVQRAAANVLGSIGPEAAEAVPALMICLLSEDVGLQLDATRALGKIGPAARESLPLVALGLGDPFQSKSVSDAAIQRIDPGADVVGELIKAFDYPQASVRVKATRAIMNLAGSAKYGMTVSAAVPALVDSLSSQDVEVRRAVVKTLERIGVGARQALPALTDRLMDQDSYVRTTAAKAIQKIDPSVDPVSFLVEPLQGVDLERRFQAAIALAEYGPAAQAAVPALIEMLGSDDWRDIWVAGAALEQIDKARLSELAGRGDRGALVASLGDENEDVRQASMAELRKLIASSEIATHLVSGVRDPHEAVRIRATRGIQLLGPDDAEAVAPLIELLAGGPGGAANLAEQAIRNITGESDITPVLIEALGADEATERQAAARLLEGKAPIWIRPIEKVLFPKDGIPAIEVYSSIDGVLSGDILRDGEVVYSVSSQGLKKGSRVDIDIVDLPAQPGAYAVSLRAEGVDGTSFTAPDGLRFDVYDPGKVSSGEIQLPTVPGRWQLVFNDEFDGTELDTTKWSFNYPWGHTHNYRAYVTEKNLIVSGGLLRLKAENVRHPDAPPTINAGGQTYSLDFTSAAIHSQRKFEFTYGYIEAKLKVPGSKGFWPAFWMLNGEGGWPPEVDIVEILTRNPRELHTNYHYGPSWDNKWSHYQKHTVNDLSEGFNVYGFEWDPTYMKWYLNGVQIGTAFTNKEWIAQAKNMYILLNLAVGGWGGDPDSSTVWPAYFECDWVRVWQRMDE